MNHILNTTITPWTLPYASHVEHYHHTLNTIITPWTLPSHNSIWQHISVVPVRWSRYVLMIIYLYYNTSSLIISNIHSWEFMTLHITTTQAVSTGIFITKVVSKSCPYQIHGHNYMILCIRIHPLYRLASISGHSLYTLQEGNSASRQITRRWRISVFQNFLRCGLVILSTAVVGCFRWVYIRVNTTCLQGLRLLTFTVIQW